MNGKQLNTKGAVWKTIRMANSRVKAHGAKWRKWYNTQRLWRETRRKSKDIPVSVSRKHTNPI